MLKYIAVVVLYLLGASTVDAHNRYLEIVPTDTIPKKVSLAEIVIKGKKPPVAFKIDRQVFRASEFIGAQNGSGIELIKNLPSVSVNALGEISFRGSTSFQVLINGRPTQGDPSFVIGQLSASSIEAIEVVSAPGASFDAEGKSGVLNIITKTAPEKGLMTQVNVMNGTPPLNDFDNARYNQPQRRSVDISMGFQKGKWDLSGGVNYLRNDQSGLREGDVFTVLNSIKTAYPSVGERSFKRYNYGGRLNATFVANEKNRIDFSFYRGYRFQSRVADLLYSNSKTNILTGGLQSSFVYFNENTQEKNGVFDLIAFSTSNQLTEAVILNQSIQYESAGLEGVTTNKNFSYPGLKDIYQETINPSSNPLSAYRYKLDLSLKKEKYSFLVGYQFRYDIQKGNFEYKYRDLGATNFLIDPFFTNRLVLQNNIHAGYFQLNGSAANLAYQMGLRAEHTNRRLSYQGSNGEQLKLLNLFPSYRFDYALNEKTHVKHSFARRIKRTNNFELNPFPEREHSETLEKGDPSLLPELSALWELGIEKKLKKGVISFSIYHQRIKNPIQRVNNVFNDTILNRIFTNAGLAKQTGLEFNFLYRVGKRWQISVGGNTYRYDIKGSLFNASVPFSNGSWVYVLNSTQTITLPSNWLVQLGINYLSLRATAQGEDGAFFTPNLSVKKSSTNSRWNFQINWLYMDGGLGISNRQRITTQGPDFYTTTNYIYEPDQLQFSVGFNLSRKNRKIALPQSEMAEKEF